MTYGVYDAKDTTVIVDGIYITGLGDSMITGEKEEDFFTTAVGAQGDVIKNITNNSLGTITITVQAVSPQKPFLMSLANRRNPFPIWIVNKALGETMGGSLANLKKHPTINRAKEAEDLEFSFTVFDFSLQAV